MSNLLPVILILLTSFWCNGITFLCERGEIFEKVGILVLRLPKWISKPLLVCISCMASIHTLFVMLIFGWARHCLSWDYMRQYFIVAIGAVFLNGLLFLIRKNLEHRFFENNREESATELEDRLPEKIAPELRWVKAIDNEPENGATLALKIRDQRDFGTYFKTSEHIDDKLFQGLFGTYRLADVEYLYEEK